MTRVDFRLSDRWYPAALRSARLVELEPDLSIRVVTVPYFLAMKIDAFEDRGDGDWQASADIQDILTVAAGCADVAELVRETEDSPLIELLSSTFREWTDTGSQLASSLPVRLGPPAPFVQHARGHFPGTEEGAESARVAIARLRAIGGLR